MPFRAYFSFAWHNEIGGWIRCGCRIAAGRSEDDFAGLWLSSFTLWTEEEHGRCELLRRTAILYAISPV